MIDYGVLRILSVCDFLFPMLMQKRRLALLVLLAGSIFGTATRADTFLRPAGPVSSLQAHHFWYVIAVMMLVLLPVFTLTPWLLWRFRYRKKASDYRPSWGFSLPWEIALWGVPLLVFAILAPELWKQTHKLDPYIPLGPIPIRVQVIGLDWNWLFLYPDLGIATVDAMTIPVGRPVEISLTSNTVMQSFFVPALASQIYAMPRMVTHLNLAAQAPGTFIGENTQYNGRGFYAERFVVSAIPSDRFDAWASSIETGNRPLTADALSVMKKKGTRKDLIERLGLSSPSDLQFNAVPNKLFDEIAHPLEGNAQ